MSDTQNAMESVAVTAEAVLYGPPDWTVIGTATNSAVTATAVAVANKQNWCYKAIVSFSGASGTSANVFTIKDGTSGTTLFQANIPAAVTAPISFDFSRVPIRGSTNTALVAGLNDPGASVTATITIIGRTQKRV